ncbi:hypothetical protein NM688_g4832 [Phlebia brevispora]|uniref:Uncharacterized protein n=1 Tax=Phlebia brevispora TaxID=194682 RepID=A0ACC1T1J3_9APHY|nr:hypothetical protein NM688_g4832 [Phlebia brevispora]
MACIANTTPSELVAVSHKNGLPLKAEHPSRKDSLPPSPTDSVALPSLSSSDLDKPERTRIRLCSAFVMFFVLGWGDGVTGTLLPYFKADFHLSFMTSSLCFVASTVGFSLGTVLVERLLSTAGRIYLKSGKVTLPIFFHKLRHPRAPSTEQISGFSAPLARYIVVFIATLLHPIFFIIMGCRRNFASVLIAYVISAFARSLLSATMNFFCASTSKKALGYMYGYWSIGSMCAPLVCQSLIAHGVAWNHFYFGSLVLSAISSSLAFFAFKPTAREYERDAVNAFVTVCEKGTGVFECSTTATSADESNAAELKNAASHREDGRALGRAFRVPVVWAFSIFCGLYTGNEASTQGFIVTYLLNVRNADPKVVGYATSGFWGGLALSRFLWGHFNSQLSFRQRKHVIHLCILLDSGLALCMHLLIWFVKSFIENTLSTAVVGFAYGPIFPGNMGQASEVFSDELRMIAMAIMGAFGSLGAALFPFLMGTLSNIEGPQTFIYVVVGLTTTLLCMWHFMPSSVPARTPS